MNDRSVGTIILMSIFIPALLAASAAKAEPISAALADMQGEVKALLDGEKDWIAAETGMGFKAGDAIKTGADGRATLIWDGGHAAVLSPLTQSKVEKLTKAGDGSQSELSLEKGRLYAKAARLNAKGSVFSVRTPTATAAVRGTGFEVAHEAGSTTVSCLEGAVALTVGDEVLEIAEGFMAGVAEDGAVGAPQPIPAEALEKLKAEDAKAARAGGAAGAIGSPFESPADPIMDEAFINGMEEFEGSHEESHDVPDR